MDEKCLLIIVGATEDGNKEMFNSNLRTGPKLQRALKSEAISSIDMEILPLCRDTH